MKQSQLESTRDDEVLDVQAAHAALKVSQALRALSCHPPPTLTNGETPGTSLQSMYDEQQIKLRELEPEMLTLKIAHEELTAQHNQTQELLSSSLAEKDKLEARLKEAKEESQQRLEELGSANRAAIAASTAAATSGER